MFATVVEDSEYWSLLKYSSTDFFWNTVFLLELYDFSTEESDLFVLCSNEINAYELGSTTGQGFSPLWFVLLFDSGMEIHACYSKGGGQRTTVRASSLVPQHEFQGLKSGPQAWPQVPFLLSHLTGSSCSWNTSYPLTLRWEANSHPASLTSDLQLSTVVAMKLFPRVMPRSSLDNFFNRAVFLLISKDLPMFLFYYWWLPQIFSSTYGRMQIFFKIL